MERHDEYHLRQVRHMMISPARADPFFEGELYQLMIECS